MNGTAILNFSGNFVLPIGGALTMNGTSSIQGTGTTRGVSPATFTVPGGANVTFQNVVLTVTGLTTLDGTLTFNTAATATKTFTGGLTISSTGTFTNTASNVPITIGANMVNGGTFSQGTGRVTFTGAASNTITGTAATTAFGGGITINKGTSQNNILDVQSVITMSDGGLTLTNGTFSLSSNSTIVPFTTNPNYGANARLWCNGGTMNSIASINWTFDGTLEVSAGTINFGTAANNRIQPF